MSKRLTLTGWGKTPPGETYFDADTHPDMPVAYAARISMAFPIAFKAVSIETAEGGWKVYADGGIGSNMPSEVFTRPVNARGVRVPLAGPEMVLDYLSRYTHRVAVSNERIVGIDAQGVRLRVRADDQGGKRTVHIDGAPVRSCAMPTVRC